MIRVTIYNEFRHEKEIKEVKAIYPEGMHEEIKKFLECDDISVTCVTLDMPECGLTEELLAKTDVLIWWGHAHHEEVPSSAVNRVWRRVLDGMGLVVLHSGHHSKIFRKLMGTSCNLKWHENDRERVWCVNPSHPIAAGIPQYFELENEEMYGEPFAIPNPDEVIFLGWFKSGEAFRSGVTFRRENGKIFYFQPGHEEYPIFKNPYVQQIIRNGVRWAAPAFAPAPIDCPWFDTLEK